MSMIMETQLKLRIMAKEPFMKPKDTKKKNKQWFL